MFPLFCQPPALPTPKLLEPVHVHLTLPDGGSSAAGGEGACEAIGGHEDSVEREEAARGRWGLFPVAESWEGGGTPLGSFRGRLGSREPTRPCRVAQLLVLGGVAMEVAVGMGYGFTKTGTVAPSCASGSSLTGLSLFCRW